MFDHVLVNLLITDFLKKLLKLQFKLSSSKRIVAKSKQQLAGHSHRQVLSKRGILLISQLNMVTPPFPRR
jgi:hypothetical protein